MALNHLAHLHLADLSPRGERHGAVAGGLAGDFVRGVDIATLDPAVRAGIEQHREIDTFTDAHPVFRRSRDTLPHRLRHWRGVLVDVYYDHFLARNWSQHDTRSLAEFRSQIYASLRARHTVLPPALRKSAPLMIEDDWLAGYAEIVDLERLFGRMAGRVRRTNPFAAACDILRDHYTTLEQDFAEFYPDLQRFVMSHPHGLEIQR